MALLDNDVILVYDVSASTLKKCAIGNLATNVASNDVFLVERPQGASFSRGKMTYSNWKSSAQSGDLLLVETAGRKSGNEVKKKTTKSSFDTKVAGVDIYNAVVPIDVIPVYTSDIPGAVHVGSGTVQQPAVDRRLGRRAWLHRRAAADHRPGLHRSGPRGGEPRLLRRAQGHLRRAGRGDHRALDPPAGPAGRRAPGL